MAYEPSTPVGQVRLLTGDKVEDNYIFSDAEIEQLLAMNNNDVYLAGADALDAIASNAAYTLKVITILDVRTDGKATAEALRKQAETLRKKSADEAAIRIECGVAGGYHTTDLEDLWWLL